DVFQALRKVDLPLAPIWCGGPHPTRQEREQWSSGCNFVAVRPGVVLGYTRNEATMREMEREGGYRIVDAIEFLTGEVEIEEGDRAVIAFEGAEPRFAVSVDGVWSLAEARAVPAEPPPTRSLRDEEWVVVDLETTGGSPKRGHRLTEVAAVRVSGGAITDTYATLVNPDRRIP